MDTSIDDDKMCFPSLTVRTGPQLNENESYSISDAGLAAGPPKPEADFPATTFDVQGWGLQKSRARKLSAAECLDGALRLALA